MHSAIYEGRVEHRRAVPVRHAFRYPLFMLLLVYPFVIITNIQEGEFLELAMFHMFVIAGFSVIYYIAPSTRALPPWLRVHPIAFLPMTVLMPVAYLLLTPLGLFTLDTSSWQTRGHQGATSSPPSPSVAARRAPSRPQGAVPR